MYIERTCVRVLLLVSARKSFLGSAYGKESTCSAGSMGSDPDQRTNIIECCMMWPKKNREASQELTFMVCDIPDTGPGDLHVLYHSVSITCRVVINIPPLQMMAKNKEFL